MEKGREEGNEREDSSYWVGEIFFLFFFLEGGRASRRLSGANGKVKEGIGCWTSGSINGFYRGESRVLRLIYGFLRISFFFFFFLGKEIFASGFIELMGNS